MGDLKALYCCRDKEYSNKICNYAKCCEDLVYMYKDNYKYSDILILAYKYLKRIKRIIDKKENNEEVKIIF